MSAGGHTSCVGNPCPFCGKRPGKKGEGCSCLDESVFLIYELRLDPQENKLHRAADYVVVGYATTKEEAAQAVEAGGTYCISDYPWPLEHLSYHSHEWVPKGEMPKRYSQRIPRIK